MAANEMQSTGRLLVERDAALETKVLLVKYVLGSSGPTIANEMQPTNRLLVERDAVTGTKILLVKRTS